MKRMVQGLAALSVMAGGLGATPASADQVIGVHGGLFTPKSLESRFSSDCFDRRCSDVLSENATFLVFDPHDFNGPYLGGEWMVGLGDFFEVGGGIGWYQRGVPTVYRDYVNVNGDEIAQELKLRIVPLFATARIFPLGRRATVQPYVGGGVAAFMWRYSETGEFVDFSDNSVFRDTFVDDGTEVGPIGLTGLRVRVSDASFVGGELRWSWGKATLDPSQGFAGGSLDLGGLAVVGTFHLRF